MSTHNIQCHDMYIVFLSYRKNFVGTQKRVRINHGKRAIGVGAIEVRLYNCVNSKGNFTSKMHKTVTAVYFNYSQKLKKMSE